MDSRSREKLIITLTRDVGPLLQYRFPIVIHLLVSQRQADRYDTKALNSIVDNCEIGRSVLSPQGSSHTKIGHNTEVFSLCLATSSTSEVKSATRAVYRMKDLLRSSMHTDLVGISSRHIVTNTWSRYDIGMEDVVVPKEEDLFYSTTRQECYIDQCVDLLGGDKHDIRFIFGGFLFLFDVRLFESEVDPAGIRVKLTRRKPSSAWGAFFASLGSCTLTGENAGKTWNSLYRNLDHLYDIQIQPARIVECNTLMVASGCGNRFRHLGAMLYQTVGSHEYTGTDNNWSRPYEDLEECAKLHLIYGVSSLFNTSWIYTRLFLEDVFPVSIILCFVFGLSKPELELYLSDCLLETLNGLAVSGGISTCDYNVCRVEQFKFLESSSEMRNCSPSTILSSSQVQTKIGVLRRISSFEYRSVIHGGIFTALAAQCDMYRRYIGDPEEFSAFFIDSHKYGSFIGLGQMLSSDVQSHRLFKGDVLCTDPLTMIRTKGLSMEYHPEYRNIISELRTYDGVRAEIDMDNLSSKFLRSLEAAPSGSLGIARRPVDMIVESMLTEGTSVMEEINAIYVSGYLYSSDNREANHGHFDWWSSALGQNLEKILRIFFYQLTGRSLPYIGITRLYESTCAPCRGFNNLLTPMTESFKRRPRKKQPQTILADEKGLSKSVPESIPTNTRTDTLKKFRVTGEEDSLIQKTEFSHPSEWNVIHSPPVQLVDKTPGTSKGKFSSKSTMSRLDGKGPHPGGRGPSERQSR